MPHKTCALCCCLFLLCLPRGAAEQPPAVPAESSDVVVEGAILKTIESTTLAAQLAGTILELKIKEGTEVEAGQVLGKLRDEAVLLKLQQLKTQVEIVQKKQANDINLRLAKKGAEVAQNEFQRALSANERVADTYPINEIDRLRLIADRAQLEIERAQYDRELAKLEIEVAISEYRQTYELYTRHQIAAPASGIVVSVEKRPGEWVEPGTDLLNIVRIDPLRIEGFIDASRATPDLVGRAAQIKLMGAETTASQTATVVFVSPDVNPINSQVRVFLEIANPDGKMRPGTRVNAWIDAAK